MLIDTADEEKWRTPFAVSVNPIWRTACAKLYWFHYQRVLRVPDQEARIYYLTEAASGNWSTSTLDRNISTLYYHRPLSSQDKATVEKELIENTKMQDANLSDFIRNPAVLEFLNLPANKTYTESQLEQGLIDNLQKFLLELGKGFAFVARQNQFAFSPVTSGNGEKITIKENIKPLCPVLMKGVFMERICPSPELFGKEIHFAT